MGRFLTSRKGREVIEVSLLMTPWFFMALVRRIIVLELGFYVFCGNIRLKKN